MSKLISGADLVGVFSVLGGGLPRDPMPPTGSLPSVMFRWAVENVAVGQTVADHRSLGYYAGVGIDYFRHDWANKDALIDAICGALDENHKSA